MPAIHFKNGLLCRYYAHLAFIFALNLKDMSIFNHFKHLNLSPGQETALTKLEAFLDSPVKVFMLKGYAGSGKTTILKGLAEYLIQIDKKFALMAPTGRAAKVLRDKTGYGSTIHKGIYNFEKIEALNQTAEDEAEHSFHYFFPINKSEVVEKVIIVDESSMISSKKSNHELFTFGTNVLLDDLMTFASLKTTRNKIIFVGDPAQLPPFGDSHSWALDKTYFERLNISCDETEMKQVLRQGNNLILKNAETIRKVLDEDKRIEFKLEYDNSSFIKTEPVDIIERYTNLFPKPEVGNGVIISFSNAQCYHYNVAIREQLFPEQQEIVAGDLLLINNNNYHTYGTELYNGDIAKVISVSPGYLSQSAPVWCDENGEKVRKIISLNFREVTIRVPSCSDDIICYIIDSHLNSIERDLSITEMKALYINFIIRFNEAQQKRKDAGLVSYKVGSEEFKQSLKADRFFNALRVKFGYAITCHKAQGGEWDKIFVDYYGRVSLKNDPLRWCYTATTRGINAVYAINPPNFGKLDKFKFSPIGSIGKIPNESLALDNVVVSPFHSEHHHKCKSLKYWQMVEKLENTQYTIKNVESLGDYLERYTILNGSNRIQLQANHKISGHFIDSFRVINSVEKSVKDDLEALFNADFSPSFNINYSSKVESLEELYSMMQYECSNMEITITNVLDGKYFVTYYLKTNAVCSYIQFFYNDKGQLTTAMPKTFNCQNDEKLQSLINNLTQYAS